MKYEYKIASRYFFHRKGSGFVSLISFISVAGIALGVMALIVVISVMDGFESELKRKIVGANPHITIIKKGGISDYSGIIKKIYDLRNKDIISAAPFIEGQTLIKADSYGSGVIVKGISPEDALIPEISNYVKYGNVNFLKNISEISENNNDAEELGELAIGLSLAKYLGVTVGDEVVLVSPVVDKKFLRSKVDTYRFKVGAVFEFGMNTIDTTFVVMPLSAAEKVFKTGGKVTAVSIKLNDVFKAGDVKKILKKYFAYPYWISTWIDVNKNFFRALRVEKSVMAVLLFLIILVAAFNTVSTLIMVVMEKTKDIGILKAIGASASSIGDIFLIQGFFIGIIGTFIGACSGLWISFNLNAVSDFLKEHFGLDVFPKDIYYFSEIPVNINTLDVIFIVTGAVTIVLLASVYPALRGAALNPVEALKYE